MSFNENESLKNASPVEMEFIGEQAGKAKVEKKPIKTFISAMMAGLFIALGFVFYTTTQTGLSVGNIGMDKFVGGLVFSTGLIAVIVCGVDLFTSSTLIVVTRLDHHVSTAAMIKNWIIVYLGNFAGSLFLVLLLWGGKEAFTLHGQWGLTVLETANAKMHHTFGEAVCLGILCNMMVCLAVWLSYSGRTLVDKMLIVILPIALFVASGFEHCVANMFMVPMGLVTKSTASPEFWKEIGKTPADYADLNLSNFMTHNLLPVTIGNIIGGAVVIGCVFWYLHHKKNK